MYVHLEMLYKARGENDAALRRFERGEGQSKVKRCALPIESGVSTRGDVAKSKREITACEELRQSEDAERRKSGESCGSL